MLETFALKQQLDTARQELAQVRSLLLTFTHYIRSSLISYAFPLSFVSLPFVSLASLNRI